MLDQIRAAFPGRPRSNGRLWALLHDLAVDLDSLGTFNVLMSDGRYLYVYCSTRMCWITRQHPFGLARLSDTGLEVDFSLETTPRDVVTMIASRKLTDNEEWTTMAPGSLLAFRHGKSHKIHAPLVAT